MNEEEQKTPDILKKLLKNEEITILEFTYLKSLSNKFNIVGLNLLLKILNRINNNTLNELYLTPTNNILIKCDKSQEIMIDHNYIFTKFKKNIELKLNDDQKEASKKIIEFILNKNENSFGTFGYAGTGKTTILVELLTYLIKNKYIKSVVFTAPTNKALNVIKSKIRNYLIDINNCLSNSKIFNKDKDFEELVTVLNNIGIKIEFMTIHKLLKFESELSDDGDLIFVRNSGKNLIGQFDIIIFDECSMIPIKMLDVIISEANLIDKDIKKSVYVQMPKLIFAGDPAQLPPIFEDKSAIFIKNKKELSINKYISFLEAEKNDDVDMKKSIRIKEYDDDIKQQYEKNYKKLVDHVLNMSTITMKEVMRNRINAVVELCYQTRLLALNKVDKVNYEGCIGKEGVYFFDVSLKSNKVESEWFKKFQKKILMNKPSIIITWTNKQAEIYNNTAREMIFNEKQDINRFEKGDILILGNVYDVSNPFNDTTTRLHTSEQIKVINTSLMTKKIEEFEETLNKESLIALTNGKQYNEQYKKTVEYINSRLNKSVRAWKLNICKLDNPNEIFEIWVIEESYENKLKYDKELSLTAIKRLKKNLCSKFNKKEKQIIQHVINPIKKEWYNKFVKPFASVSYGYAITCHKSQGSDFNNVFVDADDIAKNHKLNEMKQCLYTAVTRVSNNIYLLI